MDITKLKKSIERLNTSDPGIEKRFCFVSCDPGCGSGCSGVSCATGCSGTSCSSGCAGTSCSSVCSEGCSVGCTSDCTATCGSSSTVY